MLDSSAAAPRSTSAASAPARFQRNCLIACLVVLIAASWAYLGYQDWAMRHMDTVDMAMPGLGRWTVADVALVFVMWSVMMMAMMLPSAFPMLLTHRQLAAATTNAQGAHNVFFAVGYIVVWTLFSAAATLGQWGLHSIALISPAMVLHDPRPSGFLLITAGIYQCTPLKRACLAGCASPLQFLSRHWHAGRFGALRMGALHGVYCVGCCWMLMALLFVVGVMNLVWIGALTVYVMVEKLLPFQRWLAPLAGATMIVCGSILLFV